MVGAKRTRANRSEDGDLIDWREKPFHLSKGDVITIPAKTPHGGKKSPRRKVGTTRSTSKVSMNQGGT